MAGKRFPIGKILYILSNKSQKIIPAIVVEENHKKVRRSDGTLHEVMNYKVTFGPNETQRVTVDLNRVNGEVYESLDEIQKLLRGRLESFLAEMMAEAKKQVEQWYGVTPENDIVQESSSIEGDGGKLDPEALLDGRVEPNEPVQSGPHPLQIQNGQQQTQLVQPPLRDHIRRMVTPDDEEVPVMGESRRKIKLETGEEVYVDW